MENFSYMEATSFDKSIDTFCRNWRCLVMMVGKALVTQSYDVVRWGKILDICDCPRLGYGLQF